MEKIVVMLDECITKKCAHAVIEYLRLCQIEGHFLIDFMGKQGSLDDDWTTKLVPPEQWLVITSDAGRSGPRIHAKGPPLHLILPKRNIVGFFLRGKSLTQAKGTDRARILIMKMPGILEHAKKAAPGQRHIVSQSGGGFQIKKWD